MALRFYLVPETTFVLGGQTQRGPKYFTPDVWSGNMSAQDFGAEPVFLVGADVTNAQHTTLVANSDVLAAPLNLSNNVGANLATVQAAYAARNIPYSWIDVGMTWATVLRWTWRIFLLWHRLQAFGRFFEELNLDATVGSFTQTKRTHLNNAAQSMGLDTSSITLAMTVQQALIILGNQIAVPAKIAGVTL